MQLSCPQDIMTGYRIEAVCDVPIIVTGDWHAKSTTPEKHVQLCAQSPYLTEPVYMYRACGNLHSKIYTLCSTWHSGLPGLLNW